MTNAPGGCRLFQQPARRVVSITASLLTAAPASALACPVCALVGTGNNTWAYQAMSAMLTLLPLAMVGATVWWLTRLAARADTELPTPSYKARARPGAVRARRARVGDAGGLALTEGQVGRGGAVDG